MKTYGFEFESFGQYIFLKKLAQGGMAEVFLARPASQDGNGRVQVVKRILPHIASHSAFLNMFQREIRIIMGFNHPHIVQLHDFGNVDNQPYIAMEYIEGKSLKDIQHKLSMRKERMPIPMALSLMAQAATGLSYAHTFVNKITGEELHAVHRDISPHNLIVSYEGNLKVIDFGIAKAACSVHDLTQTGVIKGKAAYISPEQLTGHDIDARTDIFAMGIVLWELLTGERLFVKEGDSEVTAMAKVSNCERHVVTPSTLNNEIPYDIDAIVLSALKKDPNARISSAKEFQAALRDAMIRHYPTFSYSDVGVKMTELFAEDILVERKTLRELNSHVQRGLVGNSDDKTTTIVAGTGNDTPTFGLSKTKTATHTRTMTDLRTDGSSVDLRLSNIEKLMKEKATTRHYVMLAVYVLSLVGIKVFERIEFGGDEAQAMQHRPKVVQPNPVRTPQQAVQQPQQQPVVQHAQQVRTQAQQPAQQRPAPTVAATQPIAKEPHIDAGPVQPIKAAPLKPTAQTSKPLYNQIVIQRMVPVEKRNPAKSNSKQQTKKKSQKRR